MSDRLHLYRVPPQPSGGASPDPVERVATLTRTARNTWFGLLSYLAFVGVTLMGVEDADFFISERQTDLPLIGVSVPTNLFFYIAPFLGAMLYIHMHLYLLKLLKALGELPTRPTRPAGEGIAPWIVSDMALAQRADTTHAYPLRGFARWVAILSIFVAGPAVLAAFWWRSMPKHDELLTIVFCGLPLFASILAGWESWRALRRGGTEGRFMNLRTKAGWGTGLAMLCMIGFLTTEGTFAAYALLDFRDRLYRSELYHDPRPLSFYQKRKAVLIEHLKALDGRALEARFEGITDYPDPKDLDYLADRLLEQRWWMRTWLPGWLRPAQLQGVVFVETPESWLPRHEAEQVFRPKWCEAQGIHPLACGPGPLARNEDGESIHAPSYLAHQRGLWCKKAIGKNTAMAECAARFSELDATYAEAWRKARTNMLAALPRRDLSGADLRRANLFGAQMMMANLSRTRMEGAVLNFAQMEEAYLYKARMERATLEQARLEGAELSQARMEKAWLSEARMEGADLSLARMEGAYLREARMQGVTLDRARMEKAILDGTRMDSDTSLSDAKLNGAALRDVDYSNVPISFNQANSTFGDASVTLPENRLPPYPTLDLRQEIERPIHWPDWELGRFSGDPYFYGEYLKWQADPEGYDPPAKPEGYDPPPKPEG